jgi:putative flippase GtrA
MADSELRRIGRFATVGVGNTALTFVAFNLIMVGTAASATLANVIAYGLGIINSFYWQRRWTFRSHADLPVGGTAARFVPANLIGLLITTGVVWFLERAGFTDALTGWVPRIVALNVVEGIAIAAGLVWNYLSMRFWVFADRGERAAES